MSGPSLKLPPGADELLREFPLTEPDFEAQAQAIEARLQAQVSGATQDDVFGVPELAAEPGEPLAPAALPARSFTEMARQSLLRQDADDSAALAKELLAATSQVRRPDAEMVARVRAAGKAAPTATPLPSGERPSGVVTRAAAVPAAAAAVALAPQPAASKRGVVLATLGAAFALAAGIALFARSGVLDSPESSSSPAETQAAAEAPKAAPSPARDQAAAPNKPSADESVLNPEALAVAPQAKTSETAPSVVKSPAVALAPASKAAAAGSVAKQGELAQADASKAEKPTNDERGSQPPPEPQMKPAEGSSDSMPLSPSGGAVSTALGAVRANAQACLAGQNGSVVAVVTFASDGHVTSVTAGGPSGSCIQAALSKAHLAPFAKDRFSATTTIRPP